MPLELRHLTKEPGETLLTGADFSRAKASTEKSWLITGGAHSRSKVTIGLAPAGAKKLQGFCSYHIGEDLALVLDGKVILSLRITSAIALDGFTIEGSFTKAEARHLAQEINAAIPD